MQKWLAVVVLTLAALVVSMGLRNLTVRAAGNSQPTLVAWGGSPVPLPPTSKVAWGGSPVPLPPTLR